MAMCEIIISIGSCGHDVDLGVIKRKDANKPACAHPDIKWEKRSGVYCHSCEKRMGHERAMLESGEYS